MFTYLQFTLILDIIGRICTVIELTIICDNQGLLFFLTRNSCSSHGKYVVCVDILLVVLLCFLLDVSFERKWVIQVLLPSTFRHVCVTEGKIL